MMISQIQPLILVTKKYFSQTKDRDFILQSIESSKFSIFLNIFEQIRKVRKQAQKTFLMDHLVLILNILFKSNFKGCCEKCGRKKPFSLNSDTQTLTDKFYFYKCDILSKKTYFLSIFEENRTMNCEGEHDIMWMNFNQDGTSLSAGAKAGFYLYGLNNATEKLDVSCPN